MELLLWLYLYDRRWFLNIKMNFKIYCNLWLAVMIFHIIFFIKLFYKHSVHNFSYRTAFNQIFSLVLIFNIILFLLKLREEEQKHVTKYTNFSKVFKSSQLIRPERNDYWVRSRTIFSGSGISLLTLSIFSFIKFYVETQAKEEIDFSFFTLQNIFPLFRILIFYSNMFILILAIILMHIKVFFYMTSSICPRVHAKLARLIHSKKSFQIIKNPN